MTDEAPIPRTVCTIYTYVGVTTVGEIGLAFGWDNMIVHFVAAVYFFVQIPTAASIAASIGHCHVRDVRSAHPDGTSYLSSL